MTCPTWLETTGTDVRDAIRRLWKRPLYSLVAVGSLGLGIGANTAVFSVLDQTAFRSLPVEKPEELVLLYQPGEIQGLSSTDEPGQPSFSYPLFRGLQKSQESFSALAGSRRTVADLATGNAPAEVGVAHRVSGNYFDVLGVRPFLGRLFTPDDDLVPGAHRVVVLSHSFWTSRLGGDGKVLGRTVRLNGTPMTILGVTPPEFFGEARGDTPDVFVPLSMNRLLEPETDPFSDRMYHWVTLVGRLRHGLSREQAEIGIQTAYRAELEKDLAVLRTNPERAARWRAKRVVLRPGARGRGRILARTGDARVQACVGMTLLVLLIACANVAGLQLGQAVSRSRELLLRAALGASRRTLARQLLTESLVVAIAGGFLGMLLASASLPLLGAIVGAAPVGPLSPRLDMRVLAFGAIVSLLAGLAAGLSPALRFSRLDVGTALRGGSDQAGMTRSAGRLRIGLVTGQLAVSICLLIVAGLLVRTFVNLTTADLGFQAERLLTFNIHPQRAGYTDAEALVFHGRLLERMTAQPEVRAVSFADVSALAGTVRSGNITVEGFPSQDGETTVAATSDVAPGYFQTLGMRLLAGRDFGVDDSSDAPRVAVVNEAFARHFFGGGDPIGRRFRTGLGGKRPLDTEIVGVVRDARYSRLRGPQEIVYYRPHAQAPTHHLDVQFYVRTEGPPDALALRLRHEVAALDPAIPVRGLKSVRAQIDESVADERTLSILSSAFAILATLLAALGMYGVLAYGVTARYREIGIRVALGARRRDVRLFVGREAAGLVLVGSLLGIGGAAAAGRVLESLLFGVTPWDAAVYAAAAGVVSLVAATATAIPVRRALRVDPAVALRQE